MNIVAKKVLADRIHPATKASRVHLSCLLYEAFRWVSDDRKTSNIGPRKKCQRGTRKLHYVLTRNKWPTPKCLTDVV